MRSHLGDGSSSNGPSCGRRESFDARQGSGARSPSTVWSCRTLHTRTPSSSANEPTDATCSHCRSHREACRAHVSAQRYRAQPRPRARARARHAPAHARMDERHGPADRRARMDGPSAYRPRLPTQPRAPAPSRPPPLVLACPPAQRPARRGAPPRARPLVRCPGADVARVTPVLAPMWEGRRWARAHAPQRPRRSRAQLRGSNAAALPFPRSERCAALSA